MIVKLRNYWTTFIRKDDDFNVVTSAVGAVKSYAGGRMEPNRAVVDVPDSRLEELAQVYKPKGGPHQIEFVDLAGLSKDASKGAGLGNAFYLSLPNQMR